MLCRHLCARHAGATPDLNALGGTLSSHRTFTQAAAIAKRLRNGNCHQISPMGRAKFLKEWRPLVPNLVHQGIKAPFATKFGMHFGSLTVFLDPVHDQCAHRHRLCTCADRAVTYGRNWARRQVRLTQFLPKITPRPDFFELYRYFCVRPI